MFKLKEYVKSDYWSFSFTLSNPGEYYESGHSRTNYCNLHLAIAGHSWWFQIPELFKPRKNWVDTPKPAWSASTGGGYWNYTKREYGFSVTEDSVHVYYGIQPGCWHSRDKKNSDHVKVIWIPWKNMTFQHEEFFTPEWSSYAILADKNGRTDWEEHRKIKEGVPKIKFRFNDYDGEEIIATCYISKRMWRHGIGWCKWLGYIRKPLIKYSLDLEFSKETGYNKGSWKGGCIGHSTEIEYGENPLDAFIRYGTSEDSYKYHGRKNRSFTNVQMIT